MTPTQAVILAVWLVADGILVLILADAALDALRSRRKDRKARK